MPAVQLMRHSMAAALLALAGGCATITSGTTQSINVDSEPNGGVRADARGPDARLGDDARTGDDQPACRDDPRHLPQGATRTPAR